MKKKPMNPFVPGGEKPKSTPGIMTSQKLRKILSTAFPNDSSKSSRRPSSADSEERSDIMLSYKYGMPQKNLLKHGRLSPMHPHRPLPQSPSKNVYEIQDDDPYVRLIRNHTLRSPASIKKALETTHSLTIPKVKETETLRTHLKKNVEQKKAIDDMIHHDIEWIQANLPISKLVLPKCSRALRLQVFVMSLNKVSHAETRWVLARWKHVHTETKKAALLRLNASRRILQVLGDQLESVLSKKFYCWLRYVEYCQTQEEDAAAITIQLMVLGFLERKRRRHQDEDIISFALTVFKARAAKRIQKAYRATRLFKYISDARCATITIQKVIRGFLARCYLNNQRMQQTLEQFERLSKNFKVKHIQRCWKNHFKYENQKRWNETTACVNAIIMKIECQFASNVIQRHLRGFLTRKMMNRQQKTTLMVQKAWYRWRRIRLCRIKRKAEHLKRFLAATCIQRTISRYYELKIFRRVIRNSTIPLYLRARDQNQLFRTKYQLPIQCSAILVIQATWRKYQKRQQAAGILEQFLFRWILRSRMYHLAIQTWRNHHQTREKAALCIQKRFRDYTLRKQAQQETNLRRLHLIEKIVLLNHAACRIQRFYRHKKGLWYLMKRFQVQHKRRQCAAQRIQSCYRRFRVHKKELEKNQIRHLDTLRLHLEEQKRQEARMLKEKQASRIILRFFKRLQDRKEGQLLLARYKILRMKEIRLQQQRLVVKLYLQEQEEKRKKTILALENKKKLFQITNKTTSITNRLIATTNSQGLNKESSTLSNSQDEPDGWVKYWSEEYKAHYLYHTQTGESKWLT